MEFYYRYIKGKEDSLRRKIKFRIISIKKFGSRIQFEIFLKEIGFSNADECDKHFKLITDCRNKLGGHSASISQYNKLWLRNEDARIDSIKDAKYLLKNLNKHLEILIYEVGE